MPSPKTHSASMLAWILYVSSLQYFAVQLIVGLRFQPNYSLANNTISDLGITYDHLAYFGDRLVYSPLHSLMNASFVLVGITIFLGSILAYRVLASSALTLVGFGLFASGGLGTILVGLFPENTVSALHALGAALPFLAGNLGLLCLGYALKLPAWLRAYTVLSGLVSLIALALFISHNYAGLGIGGMERIVAYPQTVWMIVLGGYFLGQRTNSPGKVLPKQG